MCWSRVVPPEASSAIYFKKHLSVRDWTKVLAWARSIQAIDTKASVIASELFVEQVAVSLP